jgi:hypothetical protein
MMAGLQIHYYKCKVIFIMFNAPMTKGRRSDLSVYFDLGVEGEWLYPALLVN